MSNNPIDLATFEELKNMVGADFIGELIDTFLEEAPQLLATLETSLESKSTDEFRRAAHSLKSNAASFGATELSAQAKELEFLAKDERLDQVGTEVDDLKTSYQSVADYLNGIRNEHA